jgi:hypothetical protein
MVQTDLTVCLDTGPRGRWGGTRPLPTPPRQTVKRKPQVLNHASGVWFTPYVTVDGAQGGRASPHLPFRPRRQTPSVCAGARPRRGRTNGIAVGQARRTSPHKE